MIFDNTSSCEENVTNGVPQGSILGPLPFGLIINDIHIPLTNADIILYADDTVLYCAGKNSNEIEWLLKGAVAPKTRVGSSAGFCFHSRRSMRVISFFNANIITTSGKTSRTP